VVLIPGKFDPKHNLTMSHQKKKRGREGRGKKYVNLTIRAKVFQTTRRGAAP